MSMMLAEVLPAANYPCVFAEYVMVSKRNCWSSEATKRFDFMLIPFILPGTIFKSPSAVRRMIAKFSAPLSRRMRQSSSRNVTSNVQCNVFLMLQCRRTHSLNRTTSASKLTKKYRRSAVTFVTSEKYSSSFIDMTCVLVVMACRNGGPPRRNAIPRGRPAPLRPPFS